MKSLDKAILAASNNPELHRALESARATLGEQLLKMGLRAPVSRRKNEAA